MRIFFPARKVEDKGVASTSAPEDTSMIVLISVCNRMLCPTAKIDESATLIVVLPPAASAERLVIADCT
jgi:hypothetical protein